MTRTRNLSMTKALIYVLVIQITGITKREKAHNQRVTKINREFIKYFKLNNRTTVNILSLSTNRHLGTKVKDSILHLLILITKHDLQMTNF